MSAKHSTLRRALYAGVFILWSVVMAILLFRHYGPVSKPHINMHTGNVPQELLGEQWMGVYMKGEKAGYSSRNMKRLEHGYEMSDMLTLKIKVMDTEKHMETRISALLDNDLKLVSFNARLKADLDMDINGRVDGRSLNISIDAGGRRSTRTIQLRQDPYLNLTVVPNMLREGLAHGKKMTMPVFDPSLLGLEDMEMQVFEKKPVKSMGRMQEAYVIKGHMKGIEFILWVTEKGEVLREESPMGFLLVRETKEEAMKIGSPSLDLVFSAAVPFNLKLPAETAYLRVSISGIDLNGLDLDGGRQQLKGNVLEISRENSGSGKQFEKPAAFEEYLKDTIFIQSKDPQIVALTQQILKDEKDRLRAARLLSDWVFKNIEKVPAVTVPNAVDVLKTKKGDCNEHATLYTALARAAGIPARIAVGLVYKNGFLYYHAWPEIYAGQWLATDPTFGQFPADASHIRFIIGDLDKQARILSLINRVKVKGLEFR